MLQTSPTHVLPDIAESTSAPTPGRLNWVGMSGIELPLIWPGCDLGHGAPGRVDASVDLIDPQAKGIHMSRLFLAVSQRLSTETVSVSVLEALLRGFVSSHRGRSSRARLRLSGEIAILRPALLSEHQGWRCYPVEVTAQLIDDRLRCDLGVRVTYSSTCPCSSALARQVVAERFRETFGKQAPDVETIATWLAGPEGISVTPHSQRSHADVTISLGAGTELDPRGLIDLIEATLATPVQAAVKRADEQEFARLNGVNQMFCEDAARRLANALAHCSGIVDWQASVAHRESLHPHDAVASVCAGRPGGFDCR